MNQSQSRQPGRLLERNLQALGADHTAALVGASELSPRLRIEPSRSAGDHEPTAAMLPWQTGTDALQTAGRYLHSRYRPVHEARKLAAGTDRCDYLLLLGLGLGYEAEALLAQFPLLELRVVEPDPALLRSALETRALEPLLSSPRFGLICSSEPEKAAHALDYQPFFFPQLRTVSLSARVAEDSEFFERFARAVDAYLQSVGGDYRACAAYGHRWCTNTVRNLELLPTAGRHTPLVRPQPELTIVAAGPSATHTLPKALPVNTLVCDTALRSARQITGGQLQAITIDPQPISMLHYLGSSTASVSLCADIGAHNRLVRRFPARSFVSSAHPLHSYLRDEGLSIGPPLVKAGNVADTALRLAAHRGAQRVNVHGLDFAYHAEKAYVSGSFIDSHLLRACNRLTSAGGRNYEFVRKQNAVRLPNSHLYRSELLGEYCRAFRSTVAELGYRLVGSDESGATLHYERDVNWAIPATAVSLSEMPTATTWRRIKSVLTVLETQLRGITQPPEEGQLYRWFVSLDTHAARTVVPAAIHFHERGALPRNQAIQAAIDLMLQEITKLLSDD